MNSERIKIATCTIEVKNNDKETSESTKYSKSSIKKTDVEAAKVTNNNQQRFEIMKEIINKVILNSTDVLILPAGFFEYRKQCAKKELVEMATYVKNYISEKMSLLTVCFGFDYDYDDDSKLMRSQLAVAVNEDGIQGIGRKFYPTSEEKNVIKYALPFDKEENYSRIITIKNKKIYLAVCYDAYGIKKGGGKNNPIKKPEGGIDMVFNLIHGFVKRGKGSGDFYAVKHGMGGASMVWNCPVFGSAKYMMGRKINLKWHTGVMWGDYYNPNKNWGYNDNNILNKQSEDIPFEAKSDYENGNMRFFEI